MKFVKKDPEGFGLSCTVFILPTFLRVVCFHFGSKKVRRWIVSYQKGSLALEGVLVDVSSLMSSKDSNSEEVALDFCVAGLWAI